MKKIVLTLSLVVFGFVGCEKAPVETKVGSGGDVVLGGEGMCNFENPLTDLDWLKSEVDEMVLSFQKGNTYPMSIYQCNYGDGETGFLIDQGNMKPFYNCSGEILCIMGGAAGEMCPELNIVNEKLIWTTKDLDILIQCDFKDPLTDLPWLKHMIESSKTLLTPMRIYQCTYKNGIGFLVEIGVPESEGFSYILRSCKGAALCSILTEDYERYKIDFDNKQLIWTRY